MIADTSNVAERSFAPNERAARRADGHVGRRQADDELRRVAGGHASGPRGVTTNSGMSSGCPAASRWRSQVCVGVTPQPGPRRPSSTSARSRRARPSSGSTRRRGRRGSCRRDGAELRAGGGRRDLVPRRHVDRRPWRSGIVRIVDDRRRCASGRRPCRSSRDDELRCERRERRAREGEHGEGRDGRQRQAMSPSHWCPFLSEYRRKLVSRWTGGRLVPDRSRASANAADKDLYFSPACPQPSMDVSGAAATHRLPA